MAGGFADDPAAARAVAEIGAVADAAAVELHDRRAVDVKPVMRADFELADLARALEQMERVATPGGAHAFVPVALAAAAVARALGRRRAARGTHAAHPFALRGKPIAATAESG